MRFCVTCQHAGRCGLARLKSQDSRRQLSRVDYPLSIVLHGYCRACFVLSRVKTEDKMKLDFLFFFEAVMLGIGLASVGMYLLEHKD